eukprot:TRINITY_DN28060_c0_g1_i1.p1 TRINITY_DN28060_c0_g1~~TRINITY_DN28060_c0_g1_i1.p1  ORF type:complete len:101 (-),score=18.12 TRINITY_DN28060_c0_g1_i1:85-387(-)
MLHILLITCVMSCTVEASVKCENEFQDPNLHEMDFQGWIRVAVMSTSEGVSMRNIKKWPNDSVPYFFEEPVGIKDKKLIKSQIQLVQNQICINFTEISKS